MTDDAYLRTTLDTLFVPHSLSPLTGISIWKLEGRLALGVARHKQFSLYICMLVHVCGKKMDGCLFCLWRGDK